MISVTLSNEQAQAILEAIDFRIDDLEEEYLPNAYAELDYRGGETGVEELKIAIGRLKSLSVFFTNELKEQKP